MLTTVNTKVVGTVDKIYGRVPAWVWPVLFAIGCAAAAVAVNLVDPHTPGRWPTCPSLALTGLYCPGCGSLRAVNSLTRLDFMGALNMNPMVFVAIPIIGFLWLGWMRRSVTGAPRRVGSVAYMWVLLAVILTYGVLRNIPFFAPWLAPGA